LQILNVKFLFNIQRQTGRKMHVLTDHQYRNDIVISSTEMLKPHWLKSSHVTGTINAYCFFYVPTGAMWM